MVLEMNATRLSVIIPCFNEEKIIGDCLRSVQFASEIMVVDAFSGDRTTETARPLATRVLQHEYLNQAAQKNWAILQAANEWILILDPDERATPELVAEIKQILHSPKCDGYWIRRRNFFWGKEIRYGNWQHDKVLRLFRRDKGRYQNVQVHEEIELDTPPGWCREKLLHYSYRSLNDYLRKLGRLSALGADDARLRGERAGCWKILSHAVGRFCKSYFLKQGFRDGGEGFVIAFMEAYYGFFKYALLYEMQRNQSRS